VRIWGEEVGWLKETEEFTPFDQSYEGWKGNYGNTLDRWYHRGAIVIWRESDHIKIIMKESPQEALLIISDLFRNPKTKAQALNLTLDILPIILKRLPSEEYYCPGKSEDTDLVISIFDFLVLINDEKLTKKFMRAIRLSLLTKETYPHFITFLESLPASKNICRVSKILKLLQGDIKSHNFLEFTKLSDMALNSKLTKEEKNKYILWMFNLQLNFIATHDENVTEDFDFIQAPKRKYAEEKMATSIDLSTELIKYTLKYDLAEQYKAVIDHLNTRKEFYSPQGIAKILLMLRKSLEESELHHDAFSVLLNRCHNDLREELGKDLRNPNDWSIFVRHSCQCKDCQSLKNFLEDKNQREAIFPLAKNRRMHLHQRLESLNIPVTHETLRIGSPQKLVLTKTIHLFTDAEMKHKEIERFFKELLRLYPKTLNTVKSK
jgi:hypothetical protein